jgi:hypothetical protein
MMMSRWVGQINRYVPIDLCQLSHLNHMPLAKSKSLQLILILKKKPPRCILFHLHRLVVMYLYDFWLLTSILTSWTLRSILLHCKADLGFPSIPSTSERARERYGL